MASGDFTEFWKRKKVKTPSLEKQIIEKFPTLDQELTVKHLLNNDDNGLGDNITNILKSLPYPRHNYNVQLEQMKKCRCLQEKKIHDKIRQYKHIDFLDEVIKVNPSLDKEKFQNEDINTIIHNFVINSRKLTPAAEKNESTSSPMPTEIKMDIENGLCDDDYFEINDIDPLEYKYVNTLKKSKSDIYFEFDSEFRRDEYKTSLTPTNNTKSKKVIMLSSSKKIVFGFDKVENLLDPILLDEEQGMESSRDILREINNVNYEGGTSFRYLNFT